VTLECLTPSVPPWASQRIPDRYLDAPEIAKAQVNRSSKTPSIGRVRDHRLARRERPIPISKKPSRSSPRWRRPGQYPNVIYEPFNRAHHAGLVLGAKAVPSRRWGRRHPAVDPDNSLFLGTPTWSQDVDVAPLDRFPAANLCTRCTSTHAPTGSHWRDKATRPCHSEPLVREPMGCHRFRWWERAANPTLCLERAQLWHQLDEHQQDQLGCLETRSLRGHDLLLQSQRHGSHLGRLDGFACSTGMGHSFATG